tara:strand:- start:1161 stop:1445 length:285 start_codon:yes stop_codon:yes gene_type:complete
MSDKKDETTVKFKGSDGGIVFLQEGVQEQYIIPMTDDAWAKNVRETIAFFIYATQRLDWIIEFQESLGKILEEDFELSVEEKKAKDRSHLKVVK